MRLHGTAFGSSAWARKADTIVDIKVDPETEVRDVQLLTRTGKPQRLGLVFEDGVLVPREPAITVGPAPEVSGPGSEMPSIREIRRKYRCGQAN
jgi:hypothetical protein